MLAAVRSSSSPTADQRLLGGPARGYQRRNGPRNLRTPGTVPTQRARRARGRYPPGVAGPPRPAPALEGELVRLRAVEPTDGPDLNAELGDPEVLDGLLLPFPQSQAAWREFVEASRGGDDLLLTIETLEDRRPIGGCGLRRIDARARTANLGIWIAKGSWDRGYGTDATRVMCRFAFRHMGLQRIQLDVFETNPRAVRAYEKVGFKEEGRLRRAHFVGGRHVDTIVMGLLAEELVDP